MKTRLLKSLYIFGVTTIVGISSFSVSANANNDGSTSAGGKYENLIQVLPCPSDKSKYGEFNDYGYWEGGTWCGQSGRSGYWVWAAPKWYVWEKKLRD